eukprot:CAMPEP_0116147564 /NCGR_PEP_ID=MMETSP0329-20121206/17823_1 /TAXON_ID=697910 /ORGANISM="Pseudo-nitzschia arenysensis, Strain B593" /LENGTH=875 /DNA_ID=CAMNT_0003643503 /DNA_START=30 /DNA_END=2657 /DNA_ORIENTATION=+
MSSTIGELSTVDEDAEDSTYDRYSVNPNYRNERDGDESTLRHLSVASESSYDSRTYGTSCLSEGSETLEQDESYDEEFEELSLESQHMVMDHWVDNSCTCLDYPAMIYQKLCMQTETSLLRESKGISRSFSMSNSPTNLGVAAAKRRNLRLKGKAMPKVDEANEGESSERNNELRQMQIQPREDFERKRFDTPPLQKQEPEGQMEPDTRECSSTVPLEPAGTRSEDSHESERITEKLALDEIDENMSNDSTKSMLERAIQKVAKEDEERDTQIRISNSSRDVDTKADPPSDEEIAASHEAIAADRYSTPAQDIAPPTSERPVASAVMKDGKVVEIPTDPSGRSERRSLSPAMEQESSEGASQKSDGAQRTDEKSATSSMGIIDAISIDDQDSWTPGSRTEVDQSTTNIDTTTPQRPEDPSIASTCVESTKVDGQQHDRPLPTDTSTVDELWIEEEAKLKMKASSNRTTRSNMKDRAAVKSAEDLWNEERMKLQTISDVVIRSQSRRELIQKVLQGAGREGSLRKMSRTQEVRSSSAGRSPPSSELHSAIERNRSMASRSMILQQGSGDSLNAMPLTTRNKDLVAVRSIEEGQRMRSSKRDASKYKSSLHKADLHSYGRESSPISLYDKYPDPDLQHPELDHLIGSVSRERPRSGGPTGRRGFKTNYEDPPMNRLLSDSRDDQESHPSTPLGRNRPTTTTIEKNHVDYDNAVLATKELRKLEKKIERQIRRADLEAKMEETKEKRRMEKKLSKKLRSIIKSDDMNAQKMSSKDIKKLEKQLAQTLNGDNENRSSKLKRIKHKDRQRLVQGSSTQSIAAELRQSNGYATSQVETPYIQESREKRPERSRYEDLKNLRSRYARRGIGRRSYARMTDTD